MGKPLVAICLAVLAGNAMAEWTEICRSATATDYVDQTTIRRANKTVKMLKLADFLKPQLVGNFTFSSMAELMEFDCEERRSRRLQLTAYKGQMRQGEVVATVNTNSTAEWSYTDPGTLGETVLEIACKRK